MMKKEQKKEPSLIQTLHDENGESARLIKRVVIIGCCVNVVLMSLKLCAGYIGNSEALVADGYHSLNDIAADIIMFIFLGFSYRKADENFAYGYGKFGTFASFLMSGLLIVISVVIAAEGIESIIEFADGKELPKPDIWTFIVILFAMACKEGLYRFYSRTGRKVDSDALIASGWHHRSDALASIATLIGVTFAHFFGHSFRVLDPAASIVIAIFIFIPAVRMLLPSFMEMMDRSLPLDDRRKAIDILAHTGGVKGIKFIRTRRNGHNLVFDIGIEVSPELSVSEAAKISEKIKSEFHTVFCKHVVVSIATFPSGT